MIFKLKFEVNNPSNSSTEVFHIVLFLFQFLPFWESNELKFVKNIY